MTRAGTGWVVLPLGGWIVLAGSLALTGRLDIYLHPLFRPLIGGMAVVLGVMVLGLLLLPRGVRAAHGGEALSLRGAAWRAAVVLLPALLAWGMDPQGFGRRTVLNRGITKDGSAVVSRVDPARLAAAAAVGTAPSPSVADPIDSLPLPGQIRASPPAAAAAPAPVTEPELPGFFEFLDQSPEGAWRLELLDMLMACEVPPLRRQLEGTRVELLGQVVTGAPGAVDGRFSLVRLLMVCCAADARPVGVWVERAEGSAGFADMDWVRVTGRPAFPVLQGRRVPVLRVEQMQPAEPPDEIFLFQ